MKKNIIHFLSAFVTVLLLFVVAVSVNNEAEEPIGVYASAAVVQSGTSGSISWTLDDTGLLTISGTGDMEKVTSAEAIPWYSYKNSIKEVVVEEGVTGLCDEVFANCENIEKATLPDSLTEIPYNAFNSCYSLHTIDMSDNVSVIGRYAFNACYSLKTIDLPTSLTALASNVFRYCVTLERVTIPANVTSVSYDAFSYCNELSEINVADGNENYTSVNGVLYNAEMTSVVVYPSAKEDTVYFMPETVTQYSSGLFNNTVNLKTVIVSNLGAIQLNSLFGENVESVTDIIFLESVTYIEALTVLHKDIQTITILNPDCTITSTANMYYDIVIRCYEGSAIQNEFARLQNTFNYVIDHGKCGEELFWIYDENNTLSVEGRGEMENFSGYSSVPWAEYRNEITAVSLPDELTNISGFAFYGCSALESISMPLTVTSIVSFSFMDCSSLREIEMPLYLERLGSGCFNGCSSLEGIELPVDVNTIESNAFLRCTALKSIAVDESNSYYSSLDGVLYNKEGTELICYPAGKSDTAFTLPDTVLDITPSAFAYCDSIERINISYNSPLETIGAMAFYGCEKLNYFFIPANVSSITRGAFDMCTSLEKIDVHYGNEIYFSYMGVLCKNNPDDPEEITASIVCCPSALTDEYGNRAESFVVPYFVYKIEQGAFYRCVDLRVITFTNNYPDSSPFSLGSVTDSEESGYSLKIIEKSAFSYCEKLEKIILPEGLEVIGEMAFLDCASLEDIYIPESVTSVGQFAFSGCTRLKAIVVFSRDCTLSSLQTSEGSAVYYGYEGSTVQELTQSSGKPFKVILENEGFSYFSGVLHITASELVSQGDDKYIYPWSRYAYDTEAIFLENVSFVDKNLFNGFTEVEVIVITGDSVRIDALSFSDCEKLSLIFSYADVEILADNAASAFMGNAGAVFFTDSQKVYSGSDKTVAMEYSEGIVSFEDYEITLSQESFLNVIFGICLIYDDVTALDFPQLTISGFSFDDGRIEQSQQSERFKNVRIEVSVTTDGEEYIDVSFNEFCVLSYGELPVIAKFTISDIAVEDGEEPEEKTSILVALEEYVQYFLDAITMLIDRLLKFFGKR